MLPQRCLPATLRRAGVRAERWGRDESSLPPLRPPRQLARGRTSIGAASLSAAAASACHVTFPCHYACANASSACTCACGSL
eukprot:6190267-Pleurochrysis_carterae.AAC.1